MRWLNTVLNQLNCKLTNSGIIRRREKNPAPPTSRSFNEELQTGGALYERPKFAKSKNWKNFRTHVRKFGSRFDFITKIPDENTLRLSGLFWF